MKKIQGYTGLKSRYNSMKPRKGKLFDKTMPSLFIHKDNTRKALGEEEKRS